MAASAVEGEMLEIAARLAHKDLARAVYGLKMRALIGAGRVKRAKRRGGGEQSCKIAYSPTQRSVLVRWRIRGTNSVFPKALHGMSSLALARPGQAPAAWWVPAAIKIQ